MSTHEPPGPKPPPHAPDDPGAPQVDFELADDALELLDLTAAPKAPGPTQEGQQRHKGTIETEQPLIASELVTNEANGHYDAAHGLTAAKRKKRIVAFGALGAVAALALVAFMWSSARPSHGPTEADSKKAALSHIVDLLPKAPLTSLPAVPQPLSHTGAPEPVTLPEASITAATWSNIDTLDGASLAAVPEASAHKSPGDHDAADLHAWAQVRRLLAMNDERARPALEMLLKQQAPVPQPTPRGHGRRRERARARRHRARARVWENTETVGMRPLQAAAFGGAAVLVAPKDRASRTLNVLRPLLVQTPQGQLVAALGETLGKGQSHTRALHDSLMALVAQRPQMVDAKLALAKSHLDSGDLLAAMAFLGPLAMDDAPDTWARASQLMWQAKQMTALAQVMARKLGASNNQQLAQQLSQASPAHRTVIRRLVMRHLLEEGDSVAALAWAMAQAQAAPTGVASQWDALRLAHLRHTEAPNGALDALLGDAEGAATSALALGYGAWRLSAPAWQEAALKLAAGLPNTSATPKLLRALDHEHQGHISDAVAVLRTVALSRNEPMPVSTLARAQVASLRTTQADDRLQALARLVVAKGALDGETLRPDISETDLRGLQAALTAQRPAQIQQAAQLLMWQDPLAQDPMVTLSAWAEGASGLHVARGGAPSADPGLKRMEQLIAQNPQDDALVHQTIRMAQTAAPTRTIGLYQTLLLRHPNDTQLTSALVEAYVAQGDKAQAKSVLEPLASSHGTESQDANVLYAQAVILASDEPVKARSLLDAALQAGPPQARMYSLLADVQLSRSLSEDALEAITKACLLAPQDVALHLRRARLLLGKKQLQQADTIISAVLTWQATPDQQAQAWITRADIAREQDDAVKTAQALHQALSVSSKKQAGAIGLRLAKLELQELGLGAQALEHLREVVADEPDNAQAQYYMALALRDQNDPMGAAQAFRRYLTLAPTGEFAVDAQDALRNFTE